ncbi:MAG TPA: heme-binding protein, partial [Blastocatellia bacterium]|nr:heme-binding protein [Blastocatellia bacterium]
GKDTDPGPEGHGLEGLTAPPRFAAVSKAGTGAFLSSQGEAFTTRTASFIVQEHFPPGIAETSGGPLFGVQFSSLLCSDVNAKLPLGLSADPGGLPLYKNGKRAGGIGVEGDGRYGMAISPSDSFPAGSPGDQPVEEQVALAGTRGFEAPSDITGNNIIVNGIRFPFVNTPMPAALPVPTFSSLHGNVIDFVSGTTLPISTIRGAQPSMFRTITIDGIAGRIDKRRFPKGQAFPPIPPSGDVLTSADVLQLLAQAAKQCIITRAAIRMPLGSQAQVNITVVDPQGNILGIFSLPDAPVFGFDVSAQKARTAPFLSGAGAGDTLTSVGLDSYRNAAMAVGLKLDGSVAFTDRAGGFMSRPFFPDGIDGTANGPFSKDISIWSPFNDGSQADLLLDYVNNALIPPIKGGPKIISPCTGTVAANGIQIFPGSVPLYKNGVLVGGLGISGDGVDQDDLIATMGSAGFEAPDGIRSDRVFVRGVRLPYVKFPRHPDL